MFRSTRAIIGARLQLNMPTTSVRDLVVHGDDLVAATYGRAFWILDDVTPLRQIDRTVSSAPAFLFRPEKALRVRLDLNQDTPIPPDMPAGPESAQRRDCGLLRGVGTLAGCHGSASTTAPANWCASTPPKAEEAAKEPPPNVPDYWVGHPEPLTRNVPA